MVLLIDGLDFLYLHHPTWDGHTLSLGLGDELNFEKGSNYKNCFP